MVVAAVSCCNACLTFKNNKAIDEYKSSINEFDRPLTGSKNYRILTGRLAAGPTTSLMQFDGVLLGEGRYLNVETGAQGMRFYESRAKIAAGKRVFLVQQNTCCMDDEAFRSILFLKGGDKADVTAMLRQHFAFDTGPVEYPSALLVMDFTNIYSFSAMHPYWEKEAEVAYFVQAPGTDYNQVLKEIEWVERSRVTLAAMYAWYLVAVPVDIVTSPFQFAAMLLYGRGMVK